MNKLFIGGTDISNYGFILKSCSVSEAEPKTNYVDIPGRNGSLDLTEVFGSIAYEDRSVKITLININKQVQAQAQLRYLIENIQGKSLNFTHRITRNNTLYIDKLYNGRLYVTDWSYDGTTIEVNIEGQAKPSVTCQTSVLNVDDLAVGETVIFNTMTYGATVSSLKIYCDLGDSAGGFSIGKVDGEDTTAYYSSSESKTWKEMIDICTMGTEQDLENSKYICLGTDNQIKNNNAELTINKLIVSATWISNC